MNQEIKEKEKERKEEDQTPQQEWLFKNVDQLQHYQRSEISNIWREGFHSPEKNCTFIIQMLNIAWFWMKLHHTNVYHIVFIQKAVTDLDHLNHDLLERLIIPYQVEYWKYQEDYPTRHQLININKETLSDVLTLLYHNYQLLLKLDKGKNQMFHIYQDKHNREQYNLVVYEVKQIDTNLGVSDVAQIFQTQFIPMLIKKDHITEKTKWMCFTPPNNFPIEKYQSITSEQELFELRHELATFLL